MDKSAMNVDIILGSISNTCWLGDEGMCFHLIKRKTTVTLTTHKVLLGIQFQIYSFNWKWPLLFVEMKVSTIGPLSLKWIPISLGNVCSIWRLVQIILSHLLWHMISIFVWPMFQPLESCIEWYGCLPNVRGPLMGNSNFKYHFDHWIMLVIGSFGYPMQITKIVISKLIHCWNKDAKLSKGKLLKHQVPKAAKFYICTCYS